jgi:ribosome-associated protein
MSTEENSSIKEQALHPEKAVQREQVSEGSNDPVQLAEPLDDRIYRALLAAADKKAIAPIVLDLRKIATFTDFFVITSGANVRQVQAIADAVVEQLKSTGERAARVEGYNTAEWVLVDYGDFIFHIFDDKSRKFYDLERLWRDGSRILLSPELMGNE